MPDRSPTQQRSRARTFLRIVFIGSLLLAVVAALAAASGAHLTRLRWDEAQELVQRLDVQRGMRVADVGAGNGWLTVEVAGHVGPEGHVFATEVMPAKRDEIRNRVLAAGLKNVSIVEAASTATGLPRACCEVIYLRFVYHHLGEPQAINASLYDSVAPGGRLAIVDFEPRGVFRWLGSGAPGRDGHGVWRARVREEVEAAGFRLVDVEERWGRLGYLMVFSR
jgi:predicted methyltransferase